MLHTSTTYLLLSSLFQRLSVITTTPPLGTGLTKFGDHEGTGVRMLMGSKSDGRHHQSSDTYPQLMSRC